MSNPVHPSYNAAPPIMETDPWDSGVPEFNPGAGSGYISSGELMAWLSTVSGHTYDDMRKQMMTTDQRNQLQEDLGHLKSVIEKMENAPDSATLENEVRALKAKYEGTELQPRVDALLAERLKAFDAVDAAELKLEEAKQAAADMGAAGESANHNAGSIVVDEAQRAVESAKAATLVDLDTWKSDLESKIDTLGKEDQLALIRIQELNSRITQATQTASNLLASNDQAKSAAIMNMKV